jgi:hypothetical protein
MPPRKKAQPKKSRARPDAALNAAIASGREAADEVIHFRSRQRVKRAALGRTAAARRRAPGAAPKVPAKTRALLGPRPTSGVLIAEGDSWFDYPLQDVLRLLEDVYLFDVESVAHKGDCVEDMAHSEGQFEEFARRLEKLLRENKVPRAILISGGGNDIAGDEFAVLLNHAASGLPALNEDVVRGVVDVRLKAAYAHMITGLTRICRSYLPRPIPIVTHGYDFAVPDGRGYLGGWWKLPGPWLEPGFRRKGHQDLAANARVVEQLITRFNQMLASLSLHPGFAHVHYLNLRGTLKRDSTYKKFWANELHPTARGFELVTKKFADLIEEV